MAKKPAPVSPTANLVLLGSIVAATIAGGVLYIPASDDAKFLVDNGMIEVNIAMVNDAGEAAARATEKGIASMNTIAPTSPTPTPSEKPKFLIETIAMPVAKRAPGGAQNLYPFDELPAPVGDQVSAFFVPATAERPEPWKTLASTVSSASKRYATKTGEEEFKAGDGTTKKRGVFEYSRTFRLTEGAKTGPETTDEAGNVVPGVVTKGAYVARTK